MKLNMAWMKGMGLIEFAVVKGVACIAMRWCKGLTGDAGLGLSEGGGCMPHMINLGGWG